MKPYIGITGFMTQTEVRTVLEAMRQGDSRKLMVGVLASQKTAQGQEDKWPHRYPRVEDIAEIFTNHATALNLIHYNTKEPKTLYDQLMALTEHGGPHLHGFQLNIAWPDPKALIAYRARYPEKIIVLQIGSAAFTSMNNYPYLLAERIAQDYECKGLVDYVLLDPSGGHGKPFDTTTARRYLNALKARGIKCSFGVAGGLSPTTLTLVEPLLKEFPDLSIDAEGRLRDVNDTLDLQVAIDYVLYALQMFGDRKNVR